VITVTGTGQEEIARAMLLQLVDDLPAAITAEAAAWASRDTALEAILQQGIDLPVAVEQIPTNRMYLGHRPSLIDASVDYYPNLAVMVDGSSQGVDAALDQVFSIRCTAFVEVMVKAGPYDQEDKTGVGEDLVNRRIQRTANAIVNVFNTGQRTLGGLVEEIADPASVRISDVFVRREEKARGPRWFWQGARIDYPVLKIMRGY
jgi:hypothetical protein